MSGVDFVPMSSTSVNKTRRSKSEILRNTVGFFLRQKNMVNTDKYHKSDVLLLQNKSNFMLQKMLETDICCSNSFVYSNAICMANNCHLIDQQFNRFTEFVEKQEFLLRNELRRFYAPMICHLYLDFLKARETIFAIHFIRKYSHFVASVETYKASVKNNVNGDLLELIQNNFSATDSKHQNCELNKEILHDNNISCSDNIKPSSLNIQFALHKNKNIDSNLLHQYINIGSDAELEFFTNLIQKLSTSQDIETLQKDSDILQFFSSKYELHSSSIVVTKLLTYLEKNGHVLLLRLIINCMHIHVLDNEVQNISEETILMSGNECINEMDTCENCDVAYDDSKEVRINANYKQIDMLNNDDIDLMKSCTNNNCVNENLKHDIEPSVEIEQLLRKENTIVSFNHKLHDTVQQCLQAFKKKCDMLYRSELPIRVIKINDKEERLCGANLDSKICHLVGGFNSSIIRLWQMNEHYTVGENIYKSNSGHHCCWDLNCIQDRMVANITECQSAESKSYINEYNICQYYNHKNADNSYNVFGGIHLRGHKAGVTGVQFSQHYPLLYSISKDGNMRCWKAADLECGGVYKGHRYPIWCMDESPVGMYLVTGSKDRTARLWSIENKFPLITFIGHTQDIECIAFHPNGNYLATGSVDLSVRLWCVTSGKLMRVFSECKQAVTSLAFSPNGKLLAVGGEESKVRIFDLAAGTQICELKNHTATVMSLAWSKTGHQIASGSRDGLLRLWNINKLRTTPISSPLSYEENSPTFSKIQKSSGTLFHSEAKDDDADTVNCLTVLPISCKRLVKIIFDNNDILSCLVCK